MSGSSSIPSQPPNYSSSSSSLPKGSVPAPTNGPEAMKLQLNIQSLSLDCSIPLGSNLGLQVAVPPAPGSAPQQHQNNPPTSTSQSVPSTSATQPQASSSPPSAPNFGPESILLGLANSFIQRLERVERDLDEERRVNVEYRSTIQRLEKRLNVLEENANNGQNQTQKQSGGGSGEDACRNEIPKNREYKLDPPSQIPIPISLPTRTTPQRYTATQEIEPDAIDERDTWNSPQPHSHQGATSGREEEEEMDDPTGLGLDDDQAILYGFKPRNKD